MEKPCTECKKQSELWFRGERFCIPCYDKGYAERYNDSTR